MTAYLLSAARNFFHYIIILQFAACVQPDKDHKTAQKALTQTAHWVGSEACAPCHEQIYKDFRQTGMGRSFSRPNLAQLAPLLKSNVVIHEPQSDYYYSVHLSNGQVIMREFRRAKGRVTYQQERVAAYQVGSGNNTLSFLEDRHGYLFEMPLTWYAEKRIWDMSPGYRKNNWRFDRPINSTCLNCHTGPSPRTPQTENHFAQVRLGIGCENCHGLGSVHVQVARASPASQAHFEETIIHPADLDRLSQMDICQRCHLQGLRVWNEGMTADQIMVGKRLADYQSVFINSDDHASESEFGIAAQADRLRKSACYQKSGSMTCTTCHDPHQSSAHAGADYFNAKCRACHSGMTATGSSTSHLPSDSAGTQAAPHVPARACSAPQSDGEDMQNCVHCHMKTGATSDIPHVRFTDHYIRRDFTGVAASAGATHGAVAFLVPMVHTENLPEKMLQQGLAYLEYHQTRRAEAAYLDSTIFYLEAAAAHGASRSDGEDDYARGSAYYLLGKNDMAEAALRRALHKNPGHARASYILGKLLIQQNRPAEAAAVFAQGEQAQPRLLENAIGRGQALLADQRFEDAVAALGKVLVTDSLSYEQAYYYLGQVWHNAGNLALARESYRHALALNPQMTLARLNTGATYLLEEKWQEAITAFDEILQQNPVYVPALFNKTLALANLGKKIEAQKLAQKILVLEPNNEQAKKLWQDLQKLH